MGTVVTVPPVAGVFLRQRGLEQWGRRAGFDMAVADNGEGLFHEQYHFKVFITWTCIQVKTREPLSGVSALCEEKFNQKSQI